MFTAGQLIVGGAFGFDNVFMVNGVDVNDNLFGIGEQPVHRRRGPGNEGADARHLGRSTAASRAASSTSSRKSGGNTFSGSFRQNLSNPAGSCETPRAEARATSRTPSIVSKTLRRHIRRSDGARQPVVLHAPAATRTPNAPNTFTQTGGALSLAPITNRRGELKLTGTGRAGPDGAGQLHQQRHRAGTPPDARCGAARRQHACMTRQLPNQLFAAQLQRHARATAAARRCSIRTRRRAGETTAARSTDIRDSPFRTAGATPGVPGFLFYHAPFFDATDPEDRNNRQLTGNLSHLLSTERFGSHELKGGAEYFVNTGIGGNSQSSTGYVFITDYVVQAAPRARRERQAGSAFHAGRFAGLELAGHARRRDRHQDDLALLAGSLDGDVAD